MEVSKRTLIKIVEKCLENAKELFDEAEILKTHKKFARAYTLFHLSNEEIGKIFLVYKFLLTDDYSQPSITKFNKKFTNHKVKLDLSTNIDIISHQVFDGKLDSKTIENLTYSKDKISKLNDFKNYSLYTFFKNGSVYKPSDIIEPEVIESISQITKSRLIGIKSFNKAFLPKIDEFIEMAKLNN
ncbi:MULTISPECIES: AbiV family abortive infection protein [Flavobacterium]|uniref:AbiV family abortive infection protein n=1 Tax=Flavobacterium TaxID=237 RepID=UPI000745C83E|nr:MULTISPECIES: AbiV family abortive infection protein [Flavobacterium]AMA49007.1 hypothetical protein AWN65_05775 [Flavobacterium covae]MCJ1809928.1 AbiV family abortive infection protein [Flavobacterium covae]